MVPGPVSPSSVSALPNAWRVMALTPVAGRQKRTDGARTGEPELGERVAERLAGDGSNPGRWEAKAYRWCQDR
jgi:hypothetical protein